jgi:hypothetical protein
MTVSIVLNCEEEEIIVAPWLVLARMNDELMRRQKEIRIQITGNKVLHSGKSHVLVDVTSNYATLKHKDNVTKVPLKKIIHQLNI